MAAELRKMTPCAGGSGLCAGEGPAWVQGLPPQTRGRSLPTWIWNLHNQANKMIKACSFITGTLLLLLLLKQISF